MLLVAVEGIDTIGRAVFFKSLIAGESAIRAAVFVLAHPLVESGEEQILEGSLVVAARIGFQVVENLGHLALVEEIGRHQLLFPEEPAEDDAREHANQRRGADFFVRLIGVVGEFDLRQRPEIPAGNLREELLGNRINIKGLIVGVLNSGGVFVLPEQLNIDLDQTLDRGAHRLPGAHTHATQ